MRHTSALATFLLITAAACTSGPVLSPTTTPGSSAATEPASPSAPATAPTAALPEGFAIVDATCRQELSSIWKDLVFVVGQKTDAGVYGLVYQSEEWDHICVWDQGWPASSGPLTEGEKRLADKVTAQQPIVLPGAMHYGSGTTNYVWGAVSSAVARVVIEIRRADAVAATRDAALAGGYFLALIGPEVPCCLWTIVAYDSGGAELARVRP